MKTCFFLNYIIELYYILNHLFKKKNNGKLFLCDLFWSMTLSITDFYSSTIAKSPNRSLYRILIDEQFACTIHGNRKFSRYAQTSPLTCVYTCVSHVGQRTLLLSISMEFYYVSMIHCTRCFYSLKKCYNIYIQFPFIRLPIKS